MKAIYILASFIFFVSCGTKKNISNNDIKKDSIVIDNTTIRIDTIYKERIKTVFEQINNEVTIPCDSSNFTQSFGVGKTSYNITKSNGAVRVVFNRDSLEFLQSNEYKSIYRQNDSLKRLISSHDKGQIIKETKKPFFADIWKILFFIVLVLWVFGITPKYILKLII